jgi:hypothetical protein
MAIDMLSIPAMEVAVERLFSSCSRTLEDRRNLLSIKMLEDLQFLSYWRGMERFEWKFEQEAQEVSIQGFMDQSDSE